MPDALAPFRDIQFGLGQLAAFFLEFLCHLSIIIRAEQCKRMGGNPIRKRGNSPDSLRLLSYLNRFEDS
jgi:hypothetical protein